MLSAQNWNQRETPSWFGNLNIKDEKLKVKISYIFLTKIAKQMLQVEDSDWVTDYEAHINSHQVCWHKSFIKVDDLKEISFSIALHVIGNI